ncbi:MAG: hypothetical protein B7Z15_19780, partial [Rhizobiales bacterium 32-66-8]
EHFKEERFVHPSALFAPDATKLASWLVKHEASADDDLDEGSGEPDSTEPAEAPGDEAYGVAAE